ncbi:GNAT family N-acetyltransferase [Streptomyces sp. NPDC054796]
MRIRAARPEEAGALSELALRSKAYWGYDEAFLAACRDELTLHPAEIIRRRTMVAVDEDVDGDGDEDGGRLLGFTTLEGIPTLAVLGMMFVEPDAMGRGVGSRLFRHTVDLARDLGFARVSIDADPHAEPFYLAMGAERVGTTPSGSIAGRVLPLLSLEIGARDTGTRDIRGQRDIRERGEA